MSEISEKARAEADRVEAEEAEEAAVEETEAEPEEQTGDVSEPESVVDEAVLEAQDRALTSEDTRHQKALGKAYGDAWPQHVRCAMCDGVGFLTPETALSLTNQQWEELLQVAAMLVMEDYVQDPNYETCPNCQGKTKTKSGAQDAEHYLKLCDVCSGNGYIQRAPKLPTIQPVPNLSNGSEAQTFAIPSYGSPAANDAWDRPAGHPHYGIPPAAVQG